MADDSARRRRNGAAIEVARDPARRHQPRDGEPAAHRLRGLRENGGRCPPGGSSCSAKARRVVSDRPTSSPSRSPRRPPLSTAAIHETAILTREVTTRSPPLVTTIRQRGVKASLSRSGIKSSQSAGISDKRRRACSWIGHGFAVPPFGSPIPHSQIGEASPPIYNQMRHTPLVFDEARRSSPAGLIAGPERHFVASNWTHRVQFGTFRPRLRPPPS